MYYTKLYSDSDSPRLPTIKYKHWKRVLLFDGYHVLPDMGGLDDQDASFIDFLLMALGSKNRHLDRRNKRNANRMRQQTKKAKRR